MPPKLLWHSNSPLVPTGYGSQTALFAPKLAESYEMAISAFFGLQAAPIVWNNIPVLPGNGDTFGNEYIADHAKHFFGETRDGLVVTLMDVWVLDPEVIGTLNSACWVPVDHDPAPDGVRQFFHKSGAVPIAMSRFGQERLEEFDPLYVPHGVDTDVYKPLEKKKARADLGLPEDVFMVGMVAANKGDRKGFQQALEAFRIFQQSHDDALLYLHTDMDPRYSAGGEDLSALIDSLQIPEDAIKFAHPYHMRYAPLSPKLMAKFYSVFDVLLNPAKGEGFGIPVLEAQACGTPAIVTDFSAMKEVCGAGWKVAGRPHWNGHAQKSWQAIADVGEIVGALEECHGFSAEKRRALSKKARSHAVKYGVAKVMRDHMLPALTEVCERYGLKEKPKPIIELAA